MTSVLCISWSLLGWVWFFFGCLFLFGLFFVCVWGGCFGLVFFFLVLSLVVALPFHRDFSKALSLLRLQEAVPSLFSGCFSCARSLDAALPYSGFVPCSGWVAEEWLVGRYAGGR